MRACGSMLTACCRRVNEFHIAQFSRTLQPHRVPAVLLLNALPNIVCKLCCTSKSCRGFQQTRPSELMPWQVHKRQEKNAILRHLRNVPYEITPGLLADFVLGPKACAVFISLRYHLLYPHYLIQRIKVRRSCPRTRGIACISHVVQRRGTPMTHILVSWRLDVLVPV